MRAALVVALVSASLQAQAQFGAGPALDAAIEKAIAAGQTPGAVVLAGQPGRVLYRKAYGERAVEPWRERMSEDTIFDAASLTKVIATTASIMKLFEQGKVRLNGRVTDYLPEFQGGKSDITVRDLMTHFSGLRPDLDLEPAWSGYGTGVRMALVDKPRTPPGERFVYSDINFILMGEIVRVVSGKPLNEYAEEEIFRPLGMSETRFLPPPGWRARIAPTERENGTPLRGVVHDPTARMMGGVAGHAGLFTTADDLAKFAEMMLNLGQYHGVRLFSPLTVRKFTEPNTPPRQPVMRGLGWDIDSAFSSNRGELFPLGSYGHTGFTGTSIWIDPSTRTYVILLSNSVHPQRRPPLNGLRAEVATIVAAALGIDAPGSILTTPMEILRGAPRRVTARTVETWNGVDVLAADGFAKLKGRRVGLITNQTGVLRDGRRDVDAMLQAQVKVTALFSPEHGISGHEDRENIGNGKDARTGLPIWSLYADDGRRPSAQMLRDVDVLVFDIQDVGARFYTYISTLKYAMQAAAEAGLPIVVLDRPNPLNGVDVEGPVLDRELISFVGCSPIGLRHGMTVGELARWFNGEEHVGAKLEVVPMKNWRRTDWWDATSLMWVDPSPNMRSLEAALLYPGVAMLEASPNWSVGRGTPAPFQQAGAEWVRGAELAAYLNRRFVPGVRFYPTRFVPESSNLQGRTVEGVRFVVTDRESFSPLRLGLEIAAAVLKLYPGKIDLDVNARLIGSRDVIRALRDGSDPEAIEELLRPRVDEFIARRKAYLLYE
ncbi:MAG: exo-beta-N-acetylmuramidase NamZ domain-containing protein [Bryobacteraceae bacterium]